MLAPYVLMKTFQVDQLSLLRLGAIATGRPFLGYRQVKAVKKDII